MNSGKAENFFKNSTVTNFYERNPNRYADNIIIDYDGRTYIRIMKLFTQTDSSKLKIDDDLFMKFDDTKNNIKVNELLNDPFHLRYYIPKSIISTKGKRNNKLVVMFNGLNELDHLHFYDMLGEFFADNNIASVLLPIPLHLNRRIEKHYNHIEFKNSIFPTDLATKHPSLFYYSYLKTYIELRALVNKVKFPELNTDREDDFSFYNNYFDGSATEITLLGYSLGGLRALGFFMKDFLPIDEKLEDNADYINERKNNQLFHSCITINSGPNLSNAKLQLFGIKDTVWKNLMRRCLTGLNDESEKFRNSKEFSEYHQLYDLFMYLYFEDKPNDEIKEFGDKRLLEIVTSYLAITGGSDPILDRNIMGNFPVAINQIIAAKSDHHPGMDRSDWPEVLPRVEKAILDFMNSCGEKHFRKTEVLDKLTELLRPYPNVLEYIKKECAEDFHTKDTSYILDAFKTEVEKGDFLKYYFRSKAFYPNFPEVIEKILETISK